MNWEKFEDLNIGSWLGGHLGIVVERVWLEEYGGE